MSEAQKFKHIADRKPKPKPWTEASELDAVASSPDGLGAWDGGTAALKGSRSWVSEKSHANRTAAAKNTPGTDYASKITHRQDSDFNEIHTDANGQFWLYNHKTNAWDIEGNSDDIPYYRDLNGDLWGFSIKDGAWTVPVTVEYDAPEPAPLLIEESDNVPCDAEELTDVNPEVVG